MGRTRFEQLMVRYFQLDPMLSQQYEQVWRWTDWPGRDGKPDTGIDLVAVERDTGALTAIQWKFYEPTEPESGDSRAPAVPTAPRILRRRHESTFR